ncbi:TetR/AcrR family transcriptional regulator [Litchfieldia alkalitelluris]|uniref:TetR/AcrR family transcriptional regulator n=1 Tax=Litchfieldia alkalitelluris TaxID=304268 RepID=UPI00099882B9|nr:TetR/AcrR family transcriptional regulator [Litchfieldia alkalitelluris]
MPKITFHNLPDDKKQKLIQAVKKEFSRVPVYEASISNIIKTANIPRGSFYQYFEDKEDAYYYLLNEMVLELNNVFIALLTKHEGNLFEAMVDLFKLIIDEDENFYLLKNSFSNMSYKVEDKFSGIFSDYHNSNEKIEKISLYINKKTLNINDDREIFFMMQIISAVTLRNFVEKFAKDLTKEEAIKNYIIEMNMLKNGLAKKLE